MKRKKIVRIISILRRLYPAPFSGSSISREPFKVLIGTVLSQRTKDANTTSASRKLFVRYGTAKKLASADPKVIRKLIKETGFYKTKAKRIIRISGLLLSGYNGKALAA